MKMYIYKITNRLNEKIYVGQTKQPIEKRFLQHFYEKTPLGQAMRECGIENFTIEIIDRCETQEQLNEREKFWINALNAKQPNGYNVRNGGGGGHNYSRGKLKIQEMLNYNIRNILINELLAKKYPILDTATNYFLKNTIDEKIPMDFLVKTQTTESQNIELAFKFLPNSIFEVKDFFKSLFASLYTMNSNFPSMRYSAVISDRKVFKTLRGVYCNVTVDNYISVILIDDKRQAIADEFIMPTKGESNFTESILT